MGWDDWYQQYDRSPSLQARLQAVRRQIAAALDACAAGPIRVVSLCAGDGRDVVGAIVEHRRRADVRAWLVDTHAESLERGRAAVQAAGLEGQIAFRQADAGRAASHADIVPAEVVVASGFLGHLRHDDALNLVRNMPRLVKPGGWVIWSRHQMMNDGRRQAPVLRTAWREAGFEEAAHETAGGFAVGRGRYAGEAKAPDPGQVLFTLGGREEDRDADGHLWIDAEQTIFSQFERLAAEMPEQKAIGAGTWQPTYGALNGRANAIAHQLLARGGAAGDRVALLLRHDGPLIAAILGVLKAGRVVVVLNATDPEPRLEHILTHAEVHIVLTDETHGARAEKLAGTSRGVLRVEQCHGENAGNPTAAAGPSDLAWLICTSGSTGTPKAVMQTHRNIVHNAMRNAQGLGVRATDRVVLMASPSGGQGVGTIWCALLFGATVCPYASMERGVTGLADWLRAQRITVYVSAATVYRSFIRELEAAAQFPEVRVVRLASEPAKFEDFVAFRRHFEPGAVLLQTLSSSETGNITQCRLRHDEGVAEGRLPVGVPAEGIEILLVDEQGNVVPDGALGEIVVRSDYLSPGYWRNEVLTAERFAPGEAGAPRNYRMGDLACRLPDGRLMYQGRKDHQVKIHGFRIEIPEVEAALEAQPGVARAVVRADLPEQGKAQLVAYVARRAGHPTTAEELRAALRGRLPGYMVPTTVVFLEAFPLNAQGKVDRSQLPVPPAQTPGERRAHARRPARDSVEKRLAEIWEGVLGLPEVGWDENFFDLGGDSLQALAIVARIEKEFGQLPPLSIFLDAGTVAAQAQMLCAGWRAGQSTLVPLNAGKTGIPLYFVHGAGGEVVGFGALARLLECPAFGLQSPGLLGEWPPDTLATFAQRHVKEILAHQPAGPCMLAGHCSGGLLALAMAGQLAAAGRPVELMVLIDTMLPGVHPGARSSSMRRQWTDWVAQRVRTGRWRMKLALDALLRRPTRRFSAPFRRFVDYAFKDALRRYRVQPYGGRVALFRAAITTQRPYRDARDALLRDIVPQATVFRVPGSHTGCLQAPHVESLAAALRTALAGGTAATAAVTASSAAIP